MPNPQAAPQAAGASGGTVVSTGDWARAQAVFVRLRRQRGGTQAVAACVERSLVTVQRWSYVPDRHVMSLLNAYDNGTLKRRMATIALGVPQGDKREAATLLAIIRATPGGLGLLADVTGRTIDAVRKWNAVPDAFVAIVIREFRSWSGKESQERLARTRPGCARVWHRKCLKCGEEFSVNSPFIRRCALHRKED